jgi:magnesium transporter
MTDKTLHPSLDALGPLPSPTAPLSVDPALTPPLSAPPPSEPRDVDTLRDRWPELTPDERVSSLRGLKRGEAEEFFLALNARDHAEIVLALPRAEQRAWLRLLPPDDVADVIQARPRDKEHLLSLLDDRTKKEVNALLAYAEDAAGGLMNPRFARVRPDATVDEAISYLRRQARGRLENIYNVYVLDEKQHLLGVVSFRDLFTAAPAKLVRDIMQTDVVAVRESDHQEAVARVFSQYGLAAVPVVDEQNHLKGIVTFDDIADVLDEEATKDIQQVGGMEALDTPYLATSFWPMFKKRAGWLTVLFIGEILTATAMTFFEDEIARAVILALFVPLIISSGGNSGSQASTLVIRAMALGEVALRDVWRVLRRELLAGVVMGSALGAIGVLRIVLWQAFKPVYGPHYLLLALTIFFSLIGVVTFGTTTGALLPFVLRRLGFDPASASAPFVATLVDVSGLVIYFSVAVLLLTGTLL